MKKTILWVLALVVASLGALWVRGGKIARHRAEVTIKATPEIVFSYLTEPERLTQWMGGLKSSEPITHDGLRVGARSREVVVDNGRRVEMQSEVIALEPGKHLAVRIQNEMFDVESSYRLRFGDGETHVVFDMAASYKGLVRLFAPFLESAVQAKTESDLARLKSLLEGQGSGG